MPAVRPTVSSTPRLNYPWRQPTGSAVGGVIQRTKLYETDFDIQRGFLVGFSYKRANLTTYVFNPDDKPTFVVAVGVSF